MTTYPFIGIYLEGMNWSLHQHPIARCSYSWVAMCRKPEDRLPATEEELQILQAYQESVKRHFERLSESL
jgi:hypothetical protein